MCTTDRQTDRQTGCEYNSLGKSPKLKIKLTECYNLLLLKPHPSSSVVFLHEDYINNQQHRVYSSIGAQIVAHIPFLPLQFKFSCPRLCDIRSSTRLETTTASKINPTITQDVSALAQDLCDESVHSLCVYLSQILCQFECNHQPFGVDQCKLERRRRG